MDDLTVAVNYRNEFGNHRELTTEELRVGDKVAVPYDIIGRDRDGYRRPYRYHGWHFRTIERITPKRRKVILSGGIEEYPSWSMGFFVPDAEMEKENVFAKRFSDMRKDISQAVKTLQNVERNDSFCYLTDSEIDELSRIVKDLKNVVDKVQEIAQKEGGRQ